MAEKKVQYKMPLAGTSIIFMITTPQNLDPRSLLWKPHTKWHRITSWSFQYSPNFILIYTPALLNMIQPFYKKVWNWLKKQYRSAPIHNVHTRHWRGD